MTGLDTPLEDEIAERAFANDVLDGLTKPFKELPPKYLYDARGSELFEQITEQPEYYPTRAELRILREQAAAIVARTGAGELVELGAGASTKARVLLDAMRAAGTLRRYVALDVSEAVVADAARTLAADYPGLEVSGVVGDFERDLDHVGRMGDTPRLAALLGGTIGNFPPGTRRAVLTKIGSLLSDGDHLLLGTDLVKDPLIIEAAYNDAAGVTAEFNRNMLRVLNREFDGDLPVENFEHVAFYDGRQEWVEMRLRAIRPCSARLERLDLRVDFAAGEELRTEISAKFTPERVRGDLEASGLTLCELLTDPDGLFAISLSQLAS
ncbi:MAG TPA: L-histidine N(alpha)-methyltransferase [Solirubrobacteraceae bacterium]|nr:L-histidine N(alpha)-methyltransferase [Solirubrobacteraceae bacterium]